MEHGRPVGRFWCTQRFGSKHVKSRERHSGQRFVAIGVGHEGGGPVDADKPTLASWQDAGAVRVASKPTSRRVAPFLVLGRLH